MTPRDRQALIELMARAMFGYSNGHDEWIWNVSKRQMLWREHAEAALTALESANLRMSGGGGRRGALWFRWWEGEMAVDKITVSEFIGSDCFIVDAPPTGHLRHAQRLRLTEKGARELYHQLAHWFADKNIIPMNTRTESKE